MPTKEATIFAGALGLNTLRHPKRLRDAQEMTELPRTWNVDVTDGNAVQLRRGRIKQSNGAFHSLHKGLDNVFYAVQNGILVSFVDPTIMHTIGDVGNDPIYYANVGRFTYVSNGTFTGVLNGDVLTPWEPAVYVGPEQERVFSAIPAGRFLHYHAGIMYIAVGKFVYHSEPYHMGLWNLAGSYLAFREDVVAIWSVENTLFVGTTSGVYAQVGNSPREFVQKFVHTGQPYHSTIKAINSFGDRGVGALVTTAQGVCFSGADGFFTNLTKDKITIPLVGSGGSFSDRFTYVCSLV